MLNSEKYTDVPFYLIFLLMCAYIGKNTLSNSVATDTANSERSIVWSKTFIKPTVLFILFHFCKLSQLTLELTQGIFHNKPAPNVTK